MDRDALRPLREHLHFEDRAGWERAAVELLVLGLLAALASLWLTASVTRHHLPLLLTCAGGIVYGRGRRVWDRAPLLLLALAAPALGLLPPWLAFSAALGVSRVGTSSGGLGGSAPRRGSVPGGLGAAALGVVGPVAAAAWYLAVLDVASPLSSALGRAATASAAAGAGVFLAVGLLPRHLAWRADPLLSRLEAHEQVRGAVAETWRRVQAAVERLSDGAGRARLARFTRETAERLLSAADELAALDASLLAIDAPAAARALEALRAQAAAEGDAVARAHLEHAAGMTSDSLEAAAGVARRRDRVRAQLQLEASLLEKAAVSLELAPATAAAAEDVALRLDGFRARAA